LRHTQNAPQKQRTTPARSHVPERITEARVVIEDWRWKYNNIRPHRSLGLLTPLEFAAQETAPEPCEINPLRLTDETVQFV